MSEQALKLLHDAVGAIALSREFLDGVSYSDYEQDAMRRSAVERQLEILGEASNRLDKLDPKWQSIIPSLRLAVGLRNRIIHGYDAVDDEMVYETVFEDLPNLLVELQSANRLLQRLNFKK